MKIGIVTQPLGHNIGGILQNWALQQVLKDYGHSPVTLNYSEEKPISAKELLRVPLRNVRTFIRRIQGRYDRYLKFSDLRAQKANLDFIGNEISVTERCDRYEPLDGAEAYIVGSDQVWRPRYNKNTLADSFLSFIGDSKARRIAYAASFGTDIWELSESETAACSRLAELFHAISVREDSGIRLCREYLHCPARLVLDPTLLLDAARYRTLFDSKYSGAEYIASYLLDINNEKHKAVRSSAIALSVDIKDLHPQRTAVEEWLRNIHNARAVITDSFHGTVFSILFHRDFVVFSNSKRGNSRITSLLEQVGLTGRITDGIDKVPHILSQKTDWERTDSMLDKIRTESIDFLKKALS